MHRTYFFRWRKGTACYTHESNYNLISRGFSSSNQSSLSYLIHVHLSLPFQVALFSPHPKVLPSRIPCSPSSPSQVLPSPKVLRSHKVSQLHPTQVSALTSGIIQMTPSSHQSQGLRSHHCKGLNPNPSQVLVLHHSQVLCVSPRSSVLFHLGIPSYSQQVLQPPSPRYSVQLQTGPRVASGQFGKLARHLC